MTNIPFQDESGLCNDLGFLAHLPELCDITFMVGQEKSCIKYFPFILGIFRSELFNSSYENKSLY